MSSTPYSELDHAILGISTQADGTSGFRENGGSTGTFN